MENKELEAFYSSTLNLPKTKFKMKANLANKEPLFIQNWQDNKLYLKTLDIRDKNNVYMLHDGPPYANGGIHIGHAQNKVLKDIILKYKRFQGYYAPYIPGWDTHGLPIEWKIIQEMGEKIKDMSVLEIRRECAKYALKWVDVQKQGFIRLGILGDWDNPYITLKPEFEAEQLRVFKEIYENGYIYKGLKPVYWSPTTETALAEAEIEYKDVTSHSIYVGFILNDDAKKALGLSSQDIARIMIWTTTPWTLPANVAVSLNKDFNYSLLQLENKEYIIIATELKDKVLNLLKLNATEVKVFKADILENKSYKRPILNKSGLIILGDHVTLDAGTGAVHTAPGHGVEDFIVASKYNLEVLSPVDNKGHMTHEAGKYEGLFYKKASTVIIEDLTNDGQLFYKDQFVHSYPHDWRSKKPVIYRATEQWFINISESDIRQNALKALDKVNFIPSWGKNRIGSMLENRPDWTISRQRVWGVPIPIFYNSKNEVIYHSDIMDKVIELVEKEGTDIWWKYSAKEIIGSELLKKYNLENEEIRKDGSILDVWFDSGVTHRSVVIPRGFKRPVDLYLEGSDQHRGWFQSSLLTSIASTFDAPYKNILTHGFTMDAQGKKMSKSLGNGIEPEEIIKQYGADILRLWVSSADYREDTRISKEIINQVAESYRKIRNTIRYILGNIYDFKEAVEYENMLEIDKWALHKIQKFKIDVTKSYDKYEFYDVFQKLLNFCSVDMSSFYLDIIKDRLYCEYKDSVKRRSAQTVLIELLKTLTVIISPVLSFTAEEVYNEFPENIKDKESIFLSDWVKVNEKYIDESLEIKWNKIYNLRKEVNKKIEEKRQLGLIGLSLDAKILLNVNNSEYEFLKEYSEWDLSDIFLVSQVSFEDILLEEIAISNVTVKVDKADGDKCLRSWRYSKELSKDPKYPHITLRDYKVVKEIESNKND